MKEQIFHTARWFVLLPVLMLAGLVGCTDSESEDGLRTSPRSVKFDLDIALASRAEGSAPDYETVEPGKLRVIMIDKESKLVEYNGTPPMADVITSIQEGFKIYTVKNLPFTAGEKILYTLANVESIISDDIKQMGKGQNGDKLIGDLDKATLSGDINGYIPMSSHAKTIEIKVPGEGETEIRNKAEIMMAYAAVKFNFTFINRIDKEANQDIQITGWSVRQVADKSYLLPHMDDGIWNQFVELSKRNEENAAQWVTNYDIPDDASDIAVSHNYSSSALLKYDEKYVDSQSYYLHESKTISEVTQETGTQEQDQKYYLTLGVRTKGMNESNNPIILGPKEFPNLKSLVRGTHVKVVATIIGLPDEGDNTLDVRVRTWINDEPIDGTWEEVLP